MRKNPLQTIDAEK